MRDLMIAVVALPLLAICWVLVQHLARLFSYRHPELGAHREEGGGCGSSCGCSGSGKCKKRHDTSAIHDAI